jgi:hypothetical protein
MLCQFELRSLFVVWHFASVEHSQEFHLVLHCDANFSIGEGKIRGAKFHLSGNTLVLVAPPFFPLQYED